MITNETSNTDGQEVTVDQSIVSASEPQRVAEDGGCTLMRPQRGAGSHSQRLSPHHTVMDSYAKNRVVVFMDDVEIWVTAGQLLRTTTMNRIAQIGDDESPVFTYISAWNPDGKPSTLEQNRELHQELVAYLDSLGITWFPAATVGGANEWFEQGVAMVNIDPDIAHDLAWKYQQEGWIVLDDGFQTVTRFAGNETQQFALVHLEPPAPQCPVMRVGFEGQPCRMVGGPYGSAAMEAAAFWNLHRRIGTELLGCGVCGRQRDVDNSSSPVIYLREIFIASRHGGYAKGGMNNFDWRDFSRVLEPKGKRRRAKRATSVESTTSPKAE